jgi:hypothetical protein
MNINFSEIPIADVVLNNWAYLRPDLQLLETSVVAYHQTSWVRPKSSPRNNYACLVLAKFADQEMTTYLLAPIYKVGKNGRWGASAIECGERLYQPQPDYQFYSSPPTIEELSDFTIRIGFFREGDQTEVIESFGFKPD